jgi:hypothetical protein
MTRISVICLAVLMGMFSALREALFVVDKGKAYPMADPYIPRQSFAYSFAINHQLETSSNRHSWP